MYACDGTWWDIHYQTVKDSVKSELWTQDVAARDHHKLKWLESIDHPGLGKDKLHQGQNSGYQAINLAYIQGAKRIYLLGYDMGFTGDKRHFFGEHPNPLGQGSDYPQLCRNFATIDPKHYGIEIINCTRKTNLDCFVRADFDEVTSGYIRHRAKPRKAA